MTPATKLEGPMLIQPAVHGDERGFFCETWRESEMAELGINHGFVQDNHSRSARGVLRGMHFQIGEGQAKLVRCARGFGRSSIDYPRSAYYMVKVLLALFVGLARKRPVVDPGDRAPVAAA